jgi:hypothetical protein
VNVERYVVERVVTRESAADMINLNCRHGALLNALTHPENRCSLTSI